MHVPPNAGGPKELAFFFRQAAQDTLRGLAAILENIVPATRQRFCRHSWQSLDQFFAEEPAID